MSYRITVKEQDRSSSLIPQTGTVGACVIRAPKGQMKPVKIYAGQEQRILNLYGDDVYTYPDIWNVIQYNLENDIWISAPYKAADALFGGVLVTKTGTIPLVSGVSSTSIDFDAIPVKESMGTGDDSTTNFQFIIEGFAKYVHQSVDIYVAGTSIAITASDANPEVLTSTAGSGTYNRTTGQIDFTFDSAPAAGSAIQAYYEVDYSTTAYFALFDKAPQTDDKAVLITMDTSENFTINAYYKEGTTYSVIQESPYLVSMVSGTKDGFGKIIYAEDIFTDDDYFTAVVNTALEVTTFVDDTDEVDLEGGSRGSAISLTEYTLGWNYFKSKNSYPADIFFDCTADVGIPALFDTLRSTYQKYSAYLLPLPNQAAATAIVTKGGYSINNRGLYFYWNWAKVRNTYDGSNFWCAPMGKVAVKHAAMSDVFNALAPAWIDENGHGGQLGSGIIEMAYDPLESELENLDTGQINPIYIDPQYGLIISSQRTSVTTLSDYSYIAHSRCADYIISNILNQALPAQICKLNDDFHRTKVAILCDSLLSPMKNGNPSVLRDYKIKCDSENNTDIVLSQRKFLLWIAVKLTPFSEAIEFLFVNTAQGTNVQEVF